MTTMPLTLPATRRAFIGQLFTPAPLPVRQLIAFIGTHGGCAARYDAASGKLLASSWALDRDGREIRVTDPIEPNLSAVRRWLGY